MKTAIINKQATYHLFKSMFDIEDAGIKMRARPFRQTAYSALIGTGIKPKGQSIATEQIDLIRPHMKSVASFTRIINKLSPNKIKWVEDQYVAPPVYRGTIHDPILATIMNILNSCHATGRYEPAAHAIRNFYDNHESLIMVSEEHYAIHKGKKSGEARKNSIVEHRYPMNWVKQEKLPYIKDIRHLSRVLNKYVIGHTMLITKEEDDRITANGHAMTMPECGGDRWELAGIEIHEES